MTGVEAAGDAQTPWVLQLALVPVAQSDLLALDALVESVVQSGALATELASRGVVASLTLVASELGEGAELPQPIANGGLGGENGCPL